MKRSPKRSHVDQSDASKTGSNAQSAGENVGSWCGSQLPSSARAGAGGPCVARRLPIWSRSATADQLMSMWLPMSLEDPDLLLAVLPEADNPELVVEAHIASLTVPGCVPEVVRAIREGATDWVRIELEVLRLRSPRFAVPDPQRRRRR